MIGIKKIIRDGVSEQVYTQLKENVVQGVWQPGQKIPSENQLVSLFGVSRASIRMAIQKMITLGLLESKVGNGTYVRPFTPGAYVNQLVGLGLKPKDQIEIMEFRRALETEALKLAVERATDEDLAELEAIHIRARTAHKKKMLRPTSRRTFSSIRRYSKCPKTASSRPPFKPLETSSFRISTIRRVFSSRHFTFQATKRISTQSYLER